MSKGQRAPAQAQAQQHRQELVSHVESLELVRCLIRVSIFHVAYLRGLFPEHAFRNVHMKNLNGMNLKMMVPRCPESKRMVDWVEKGIYDALANSYLATLAFGVSSDPEGCELIEEYIFKFTYGPDGDAQMEVSIKDKASNGGTVATDEQLEPENIRKQVVRMLRMLIEITSTLDMMPDERHVFMKITYNDSAPSDYEPPLFRPATDQQAAASFVKPPFKMQLGKVCTGHHNVRLHIMSTLDVLDDEPAQPSEGAVAVAVHTPRAADRSARATNDAAASPDVEARFSSALVLDPPVSDAPHAANEAAADKAVDRGGRHQAKLGGPVRSSIRGVKGADATGQDAAASDVGVAVDVGAQVSDPLESPGAAGGPPGAATPQGGDRSGVSADDFQAAMDGIIDLGSTASKFDFCDLVAALPDCGSQVLQRALDTLLDNGYVQPVRGSARRASSRALQQFVLKHAPKEVARRGVQHGPLSQHSPRWAPAAGPLDRRGESPKSAQQQRSGATDAYDELDRPLQVAPAERSPLDPSLVTDDGAHAASPAKCAAGRGVLAAAT